MMKRVVILTGLLTFVGVGCQKQMNQVSARIDALEKRIDAIEKRPAMPGRPPEQPGQQAAYNIPVGNSPVLGIKNAKVSVIVFSDFQCPFCARVDPLLHSVVQDPELKDKVNVAYKHFPLSFHNNAKPAAKAAMAATEQGHDKFWKFSEKAYANQTALTPENFKKWAKEIGLNVNKFEADLKNNDAKYEAMIKADMDLGMNEAKVRGTPSLYVGGWELRNRSLEGIKELIKDKHLL
jgi:protein-disulfide isomerase